jgi:hypothetical protein
VRAAMYLKNCATLAHCVIVEMVFGAPDRIKSEGFGEIGHRDLVAVDLIVANGSADVLKESCHAHMHRSGLVR